jgi:biotin carboxyl carrier protein
MQYEVEIGGRPRQVVVTRVGDRFAVAVDGHTRQVDTVRIDAHTLSLIVDGVWLADISITPDRVVGRLTVHVNGTPVPVTLNGRRHAGRKSESGASGSGPQRVAAPMPGKIVRVLVKAGDAVRARQPIVVIEAMKMENELRASREGTVTEIRAREGLSVEAGALLVVIQ